ncbi:hypothetical protein CRYUN_Cryun19dG0147400 [Craigia yunnanensis]
MRKFITFLKSEPPDIRNWFSSYKYESFVLDTCENFGGVFSEERESDNDELVGKINREKEGNFDEHGNLNSQEVQDSLHSPSILSEPTDIRNWFSSYVYESPLLDTNDDFKSYVSRENECEKDELVIGESIKDELTNSGQFQEIKNRCKQDAYDKKCSAKLVNCSSALVDSNNESHHLFSAPPDIGNWFPDYVYKSPILETSDEFRDTLSIDREPNGDKFAVGDSKRENQVNLTTTTKTRCRNEVVVGKVSSNEFGKCNSSLRHDDHENKSINKDLHWAGGKENVSWQGDVCFKKILDSSLEVKQVRNSSINSNEGVENSSLNGGDSFSELDRADSQSLDISRIPGKSDRKSSKKLINRSSIEKSSETEVKQVRNSCINSNEGVENSSLKGGDSFSELDRADSQSLDISRSPGKSDRKSSKKLIDRRSSIEKSSETEVQTDKVDLASHDHSLDFDQVSGGYLRKSTHGSNDKENEGKDIAENGFITTRKNKFIRINDENSVRGPGGILLQCSRNKGINNTTGGGKDGVVKRKVLAETTKVNVEQPEAKAMEITGKWHCPQKSKPPRGPPLKQLRLEQWIHKV